MTSTLRPRTVTPDVRTDDGLLLVHTKRCCNGCGRMLGDASQVELEAAVQGAPLPDVRGECGCIDLAANSPTPHPDPHLAN